MKKTKLEKGITLIALIITIIILLILAVVTIGSIKESKIIDYAQDAASEHIVGKEKEQIALGYSEYRIASINDPNAKLKVDGATVNNTNDGWMVEFESGNSYPVELNGNIATYEPVVNPNPTDWTIAYAYNGTEWIEYTEEDQATGGEAEGGVVEGQIVAKFYKQNIPIEKDITIVDEEGTFDITVEKENFSYKLYIEGSGEMPAMSNGKDVAFGYQAGFFNAAGSNKAKGNLVVPYVTDVIICEGVKSIGAYALFLGVNINNIQIARTVETIDSHAFAYCKLPNLKIPSSVKIIGDNAFHYTILNDVKIPEGVEEIEHAAFCDSSMTSLIIPSTVRKVGSAAFSSCSLLKEVYIYTEECEFAAYCFSNMYSSREENAPKGKIYVKDMTFENDIDTPGGDYEFVQF